MYSKTFTLSFNSSSMWKCTLTAVFILSYLTSITSGDITDNRGDSLDARSVSNPYVGVAQAIERYQQFASHGSSEEAEATPSFYNIFLKGFLDVIESKNILGNGKDTEPTSHQEPSDFLVLDKLLANNTANSSQCVRDIGRIITSFREPWAIPFLDSAGKPGPSLSKGWFNFAGNYEQCTDATSNFMANASTSKEETNFTGNYCVLGLQIPSDPLPGQWGACFPSTCSGSEITELFQEMMSSQIPINIIATQCIDPDTKITAATVAAIIILSVTGILAILGTLYDVVFVQPEKRNLETHTKMNTSDDSPSIVENGDAGEKSHLLVKTNVNSKSPSQGFIIRFLLTFSIYTNGEKVLNTSQSSGSLGSIHGIRFISMSWVVLGHCYIFGSPYSINQSTAMPDLLKRWTFAAVGNAFPSVDTFFALSGLLISYLTITELKKKGLGINWAMFYFHRFWRLTPPYMFALVIILGLKKFMYTSQYLETMIPNDKPFCEENWWTNLLYINNLVKPSKMCLAQSWYLANDMQFYIISPLMLIPFYFHRAAGVLVCSGILLISWITTGVLSTQQGWGDSYLSMVQNHWFDHYYMTPWCRIGPYVVGILAGSFLAANRGKPIRMPGWVVAAGWIMATGSGLAVVYGLHGDLSGDNVSSTPVAALYNSVARSVWGACVCWVIVSCSAGYGGPVNTFLSWSPFVVLGRLTYMTYLIHICLINVYFGSMGSPFFLSDISMAVAFLGILVFSYLTAFVLMLLLESPMIGLEKTFLAKAKKDK